MLRSLGELSVYFTYAMRITKYGSYCLALPLAATLVACGWRASPATTRPPTPPPPSAAAATNPTPVLHPRPTSAAGLPPPTLLDLPPGTGERSFARGRITQRPYIVMIDNHPDAYPQSGLPQAAIVFEALAEGGVTRFMAVYQEGITPEVREIGPVRSVRLYFAQWAMSFQPIYLHVGGSPDALALVQSSQGLNNLDLDDLTHNRPYGWRDSRRSAPHNFYSNTERLRAFTADHGFRSWPHPDPTMGYLFQTTAPAAPAEATAISYPFKYYTAEWVYDAQTQRYVRSMDGQPHVDRVSGAQLWTRNLVVMEVPSTVRPGDDKQRIDLEVLGEGRAEIFLAGRRIAARWRKATAEAQLRFYDEAGKEIVFNAGPIWIAALPSLDELVVQ